MTVSFRDRFKKYHLITLSASSDLELEKLTDEYVKLLEANPEGDLPDVVPTRLVTRELSSHRRILVCQGNRDALAALRTREPGKVLTTSRLPSNSSVAFLFPGMGDHYVNMGLGIYESEGIFRDTLDRCVDILTPLIGRDIREILYPPGNRAEHKVRGGDSGCSENRSGFDLRGMLGAGEEGMDEGTRSLNLIHYAHPAIFVVEYAFASFWMELGIHPRAMIGYSLGEYVAACLAGVLTLEDALYLVVERAKLIQDLPAGAMLAVSLSEIDMGDHLSEELSLSAINGPSSCVVSGPVEDVDGLEERLNDLGVPCRRLQTSHAFHAKCMDPVRGAFGALVRNVTLKAPKIPYLSNVTGTWIREEEAMDPTYWSEHLCRPVRFADGIGNLWGDKNYVLLEVGPGNSLSSLAMQHPARLSGEDRTVLASLRHRFDRRPDLVVLLSTLGKLWLEGIHIHGTQPEPMEDISGVYQSVRGYSGVSREGDSSAGPGQHYHQYSYVSPTNDIERRIALIWEKLLNMDRVGIYDNFFNLGGNSLLGTQYVTRIGEDFQVDVPLAVLFDKPTVAEQAACIKEMLLEKIEGLTDEEAERLV